ncbi:MAG: hypothetical protein AAGI38_25010, partial [Bacteroidota bacterium]
MRKLKALQQILIVPILVVNLAFGQSVDTTINILIREGLIEKDQEDEFRNRVQKYGPPQKSTYLWKLFHLELYKLTGNGYPHFGMMIDFGKEKPSEEEQANINLELKAYLEKLQQVELISDKHFQKYHEKINKGEFVHVIQFLSKIVREVALSEHMNPAELMLFADKLRDGNIVTLKYDQLVEDIHNERLENPIQFLDYCDKAVIIYENNYSEDPQDYLEKIHKKTATLIPELAFTNFS